ncbi:MAG TPA: NTP transferase domain-containing protein [Candidatus Limnocylindrales bacterium]
MTKRPVVGVVLAGGASRRFGADKLGVPLGGRPLVLHPIEALRAVTGVGRIVVVGPATPSEPGWVDAVRTTGAEMTRDPEPFRGPLVALLGALQALAPDDVALVVGGDMPGLETPALERLAAAVLHRGGIDLALFTVDGRDEPLPLAISVDPGCAAARRLVAGGERRLGALAEALGTRVGRLPVDRRIVRDVDTPEDMKTAGADEAPAVESGETDGRQRAGYG